MARIHRGVVAGVGLVVGGAVVASWVLGGATGFAWSMFKSEKPPKIEESPPGFDVRYAPEERKEEQKQEIEERRETLKERIERRTMGTKNAVTSTSRKQTLTEKWLENVNSGQMYAFGEDNGYTGSGSTEGGCAILQPVRVRAMIADSATTDTPGMAIGAISEDVQGQSPDGSWCLAIPAMSIVSFNVGKAGDYATNRAPTQVGEIWLEDGFKVTVDQPAKHIDGSIGVIGKANHHTFSKTVAAVAGGLFRLADNITSIGQFSGSTGEVTDPFEDMIRKRLERPSEITFTGGKVVEFDLLPTSTPGYD